MAGPTRPLSSRAIASLMGRMQAPELFLTQAFVALANVVLARNIPLSRPVQSLRIIWRGRVVIGTANYTTVACEAPQTILQRIRIQGIHRQYTQVVPIDISGATCFAWTRLFQQNGSSIYIGTTKQAELSSPMGLAGATFGNTGTYDIEVHYDLPVGPLLHGTSRIKQIPYWWFAEDFADTLQMTLQMGDSTSFGTPGGSTTVTFTAFGSGAGSPQVEVYINYGILGVLASSVQRALCVRNEQLAVQGQVAAVASNQMLQQLQKQRTLNVVVKSGVILTGTNAGVTVFNTLSDTILDRTQIVVDNKPIRNNPANRVYKEYYGKAWNTTLPQGYLPISFIENSEPLTQFRGDTVLGGSLFALNSDVLSASANNQVSLVQEQQFGEGRAIARPPMAAGRRR